MSLVAAEDLIPHAYVPCDHEQECILEPKTACHHRDADETLDCGEPASEHANA